MWIIGDHLARIAYPYLQQLELDHKKGCENYLEENYDHYAYYPSFTETNVLSMIRNAFVEGLNRRARLPNAVIIILGEQFLTEDPTYLPSEFERKIKWILREIDILVKIRKGNLPPKAYVLGQPRIMWVQAFRTRRGSAVHSDQLLKFNNLLRRMCMAKAVYTIPVEDASIRCFDVDGKTQITGGFKFLWQEIIAGLKLHDEKDRQYEINQLVDKRLKEMDLHKKSKDERCHHTLETLKRNIPTSLMERDSYREREERDFSRSTTRSKSMRVYPATNVKTSTGYHGNHSDSYRAERRPHDNSSYGRHAWSHLDRYSRSNRSRHSTGHDQF